MKGSLHVPLACDIQNKEMFSWKMLDIHLNINYDKQSCDQVATIRQIKKKYRLVLTAEDFSIVDTKLLYLFDLHHQ